MSDFDVNGGADEEATATAAFDDGEDDVDQRVLEWEIGLPSSDDLTPLSQSLIPPELASAFSISPEPRRTDLDVNRASRDTLSSLRSSGSHLFTTNNNKNNNNNLPSFNDTMIVEPEGDGSGSGSGSGSEQKKTRKTDINNADEAISEDPSSAPARTSKRPRLVWTPQLHKRFVDVVAHLGIKNAVPKTIMLLMNVEGLTRENVASHLQKYRLYLKRMQGLSNEGPSASDQLFASTPVPQSLRDSGGGSGNGNGHVGMPIPMPYGAPLVPVAMPMFGHMSIHHQHNGYEANSYGMNKYGSMMSYPNYMAPNDKLK